MRETVDNDKGRFKMELEVWIGYCEERLKGYTRERNYCKHPLSLVSAAVICFVIW